MLIIDHPMQTEKNTRSSKKSDAAKLLDVYIRNNNKQALLVHTQQNANLTHISNLIASRFQVPPNDQLLFYNGSQVTPTPQRNSVDVEDKAIIHLVDRRNVTQHLVINVRRLNIPRVEQFRVPSSQIIEDFIVRNIQQEEANRLFFVYTGRELNPRRSFAQEFVENKSELFCLDEVKDEVVGQKRGKYLKKIRKESKKQAKEPITPLQLKNSNKDKVFKSASVQQNEDATFNAPSYTEQKQKRQEKEEIKTPNFKKKNISQEINLGENEVPAIQVIPSSHQNSTSLVTDQNFQQNKSNLAPNPFFNEGSSISSICSQENHNPESSKRLDEPSVMFHSAYIGLNNQNQLTSRGGSIIANQSDSRQQQPKEEGSKVSFSFDNRAPQTFFIPSIAPDRVPDRHLTALDREEIIEDSKQDCTDSKQLSPNEIQFQKGALHDKENSKDLSEYEICVDNHQLSASAELQVEMFDNKQTPNKSGNGNNQILIEDFDRNDSKDLEYMGVQIEPIAHSHHQMHDEQHHKQFFHEGQPSSIVNPNNHNANEIQIDQKVIYTPHFDETPRHVDVYLIQHSQLAQPTESEMIQQKQQRETNRHSSNFYSSNSSRAKQFDANNQYNFGQFQRYNKNRFSGYREGPSKFNQSEIESSKSHPSQHSDHPVQVEQFKQEHNYNLAVVDNDENNRMKSIDDDHSLNIVQLPIEARIKDNSSLLIDYDSKSDFNSNHRSHVQPNKQEPPHELQRQHSGIDQLNKLFSQIGDKPNQDGSNNQASSANSNSIQKQGHKSQPQLELVHHQHERRPEQEIIQTSLNLRMSRKQSKDNELVNSPIMIKEIKGVIDSQQSLEKIQVKNSIPYFNSYTRSISSEVRFTNHKEVYNIGDFVFNCEVNTFNPLTFFIDVLSRQDSLDVYRSYP